MSGQDGLRDEIAEALADADGIAVPWESAEYDYAKAANAVLPIVQDRIDAAREQVAEQIAQAIIREASRRPQAAELFRRGMFTAAAVARQHANEPGRKADDD